MSNSHIGFMHYTIALVAIYSGIATAAFAETPIQIMNSAPNFTLPSNLQKNMRLSEHRGEVILINFWATWCNPCRQEIPALNELYQRFKPIGFTLFGINVDEQPKQALHLIEQLKIEYPVLFDRHKIASESYHLKAMPSTFIVDRDGIIRYMHFGYTQGDESEYRTIITQLLKE